MYKTVTKYVRDRGYGFICGKEAIPISFILSKLYGEYIAPGYYVFFKSYQTDRSDYSAKDITVIETAERKYGKEH